MNLKNILYFTIDGAMSHGARFLWSIVLIGLSMLGIGYFMMFTNNYRYIEEECDRVLKRGISETGVMNVTEYSSYEAKKLKEEAMASGKIECIGTWLSGESGAVPSQELILEQARIGRSTIGEISIDRTMIGITNIEFAEEIDVPEEKWQDPNWRGMYLGSKYQGISVGTVYEYEWRKGVKITYEVIGIMKEGQAFISSTVLSEGPGNGLYSVESWDDVVIYPMQLYVSDDSFSNFMLYTPAKGVSLADATDYLDKKAKELGLNVRFINLGEEFFSGEMVMRDRNRIEQEICIMLCVLCLLINACYLFTQMINEKRMMGIYFSCGFLPRDIIIINANQIVLKVILACTMGFVVLRKHSYLTYHGDYVKDRQWKYLCDQWLWEKAFPQMVGFGILLIAIYVFILINMIRGAMASDFMKDSRG